MLLRYGQFAFVSSHSWCSWNVLICRRVVFRNTAFDPRRRRTKKGLESGSFSSPYLALSWLHSQALKRRSYTNVRPINRFLLQRCGSQAVKGDFFSDDLSLFPLHLLFVYSSSTFSLSLRPSSPSLQGYLDSRKSLSPSQVALPLPTFSTFPHFSVLRPSCRLCTNMITSSPSVPSLRR